MKQVIIPECIKGVAKIVHFEVNNHDSIMSGLRKNYVPEGKYVKLIVNNSLMMSNTLMERRTNQRIMYSSSGNVLIAGLGIGMILSEILENPKVKSVTVIEKYQDVIDLVSPHFNDSKLKIICADIFTWKPENDEKFDTIYFDIWPDVCTDNIGEIKKLHARGKYWKNKENPMAWMDSWMYNELRKQMKREKSYAW